MKAIQRHCWLLAVLLCTAFLTSSVPCSELNDVCRIPMDELISQLSTKWDHGDLSAYYAAMSDMIEHLKSCPSQADTVPLASQMLDNLLSRQVSAGDIGAEDIIIMERLVVHLISISDVPIESVQFTCRIISKFMGRVRNEIVPDFKWLPVYANISPPIGGKLRYAGMSPDAIDDPTARAQYKEALEANRRNNRINSRQQKLVVVNRIMSGSVLRYLVRSFREGQITEEELDKCILEAGFEHNETTKMIDQIEMEEKWRNRKQGKP